MPLHASGKSGELRLGYQVAAYLGRWSLDEDHVEADAFEMNDFYLGEPGPFALWLHVGQRAWAWKNVEVVSSDKPMRFRVVGSPEVRDIAPMR